MIKLYIDDMMRQYWTYYPDINAETFGTHITLDQQNKLFYKQQKESNITIINNEKSYIRIPIDELIQQLSNDNYNINGLI